jgi:hypothetical protein
MSKSKSSQNYVKVSRGQGWKGETLVEPLLLGRLFCGVHPGWETGNPTDI